MEKIRNIRVEDKDNYWCKKCGEKNNVEAHYSQTEYGTAKIINVNGDVDEYDPTDWGNLTLHYYMCRSCGEEQNNLKDLVTDDIEEVWKILYPGEIPWNNPNE